jgi:hypothetical protein
MSRMDLNRLAAKIVRDSTDPDAKDDRDSAHVERRRENSRKGGRVRAERMTAEERSEAARKAAAARWGTRSAANAGSRPD